MRYLKLFENYSSDQILDCFMDIIDRGLSVEVGVSKIYIYKEKETGSFLDDSFSIDDIKETLLFAIPYLKDEYGIDIYNIGVTLLLRHNKIGLDYKIDQFYSLIESNDELYRVILYIKE